MKIVDKPLPAGRWKIHIASEVPGMVLDGVTLKGLRNRPWPLTKVENKEFFTRHPLDPVTKMPRDGPAVLRGNPSIWTLHGTWLYLWPAPAHDWVVQLHLRSKTEAA